MPSPIAAVLSRRASAAESVAIAGRLTPDQGRVAIDDGIAERILERVDEGSLDLVLISGSAGDGKSFTLGSILARAGNPWAGHPHRVIEDATHSEKPGQLQRDRLKDFFAPLKGDAPLLEGPPLIIAANIGLLIRFFESLRVAGELESFEALADKIFHSLRIPNRGREVTAESLGAPRILVVNLDERPTTGGPTSFFDSILRSFDPAAPEGVMKGAPRCGTCNVRDWCWVRSNAEIVSSAPARSVIDAAVHELALIRGRSLTPRALWDAAAVIINGGAIFKTEDPCDEIVAVADASHWVRLWEHSLPNGIYQAPRDTGLAGELRDRDPTFGVSREIHEAIARAGIDRFRDAEVLTAALGDPASDSRLAVRRIAEALKGEEIAKALGEARSKSEIPRALARAGWLSGVSVAGPADLILFSEALAQYADGGAAVDGIEEIVGDALVISFGESTGGEQHFFRTGRQDGRDVAVYVSVDVQPGKSHEIGPDPALETNPEGARIVGYKPLLFSMTIESVDVPLTYSLFHLLKEAQDGKLPTAKELERFYSLGRAVTALGNQAALDQTRPILIADRRGMGRRIWISPVVRRGSRRFREQEVGGPLK